MLLIGIVNNRNKKETGVQGVFFDLSEKESADISVKFRREMGCNRVTATDRVLLLCDPAVLFTHVRFAHLHRNGLDTGREYRDYLAVFRAGAVRHQKLYKVWRQVYGTDP